METTFRVETDSLDELGRMPDPFEMAQEKMLSLASDIVEMQQRYYHGSLKGRDLADFYRTKNGLTVRLLELIQQQPGLIKHYGITLRVRENERYNRMIALSIPGVVQCYFPLHAKGPFQGEKYVETMKKFFPGNADNITKNVRKQTRYLLNRKKPFLRTDFPEDAGR